MLTSGTVTLPAHVYFLVSPSTVRTMSDMVPLKMGEQKEESRNKGELLSLVDLPPMTDSQDYDLFSFKIKDHSIISDPKSV